MARQRLSILVLIIALALPGASAAEQIRDLGAPEAAALGEDYMNWERRFAAYQTEMANALMQLERRRSKGSQEQARLNVLQTQANLLLDLARDHHRLRERIHQAISRVKRVQANYGGQSEQLQPLLAGHRRLVSISGAAGGPERELETSLLQLVLNRLAAGAVSGERLAADAARAERALSRRTQDLAEQRRLLLAEITKVRKSAERGNV